MGTYLDELLLADVVDPDMLLEPLFELIETLQVEKEKVVELDTLVYLLEKWYFVPTVANLVVSAMNMLVVRDPTELESNELPQEVYSAMLFISFGQESRADCELGLQWSMNVAITYPSPFLQNGSLYFFLKQNRFADISLRRRTIQFAHLILEADESCENTLESIIACASVIANDYLFDTEEQVATEALSWTITAMNYFIMTNLPYSRVWLNHTSMVHHWKQIFVQTLDQNKKATLMKSICQLSHSGAPIEWFDLMPLCFQKDSVYALKQAALNFLLLFTRHGHFQSADTTSKKDDDWSCTVCTYTNSTQALLACIACDSYREVSGLELCNIEWNQLIQAIHDVAKSPDDQCQVTPSISLSSSELKQFVFDFLRNEALLDVLSTGIQTYSMLIDTSKEIELRKLAELYSILASQSPEAFSALPVSFEHVDSELWHNILDEFGVVIQSKEFSGINQPPNELIRLPQEVVIKRPPRSSNHFDVRESIQDQIDMQFIGDVKSQTVDLSAMLNCRLHFHEMNRVIDMRVHPLARIDQVLSGIISLEAKDCSSEFDSATDIPLNAMVQREMLSYIALFAKSGKRLTYGDAIISAGESGDQGCINLYTNPQTVLEPDQMVNLHELNQPLPRLTHCVALEMESEWCLLSRSLSQKYTQWLQAKPEVVPLNLRARFFLGNELSRRKREEIGGRTTIKVERNQLMETPIAPLIAHSLPVVYVSFRGERGHGVGPTAEYYSDLGREFGDPKHGLWLQEFNCVAGRGWFPSPAAITETHISQFEMFGCLLARTILDGYSINLPLSLPMIKAIQKRTLNSDDLYCIDPQLSKSLNSLAHQPPDVLDTLDLYFTMPGSSLIELCFNGSSRRVNLNNIKEYIDLVTSKSLEATLQMEAILRGFDSLLNHQLLQYFTPQELQDLLEPHDQDKWTEQALYNGLVHFNGYGKDSKCIQWLRNSLLGMTKAEKKMFLQFTTGCARLPYGGWSELKLAVIRVPRADVLPTSSTCCRQLKLPAYTTQQELHHNLLLAITEGQSYFALD